LISRDRIFPEASLIESVARSPESAKSAPEADDAPDATSAAVPAAIMKSRLFISPVEEAHRFAEFNGSVIFLQTKRLAPTSQQDNEKRTPFDDNTAGITLALRVLARRSVPFPGTIWYARLESPRNRASVSKRADPPGNHGVAGNSR
jgi:hypothetical protein